MWLGYGLRRNSSLEPFQSLRSSSQFSFLFFFSISWSSTFILLLRKTNRIAAVEAERLFAEKLEVYLNSCLLAALTLTRCSILLRNVWRRDCRRLNWISLLCSPVTLRKFRLQLIPLIGKLKKAESKTNLKNYVIL